MKKLMQALVLGLVLCFPSLGFAQPLTMDEALEGVCRVNTSGARGSGTVFSEDDEKYYIMTNGHVVGRAKRGHLEFFQDGYKSAMIPFRTEYSEYKEGTALDLAIVSVKKEYFGRFPPRVIPLAPKGTEIKANDLVIAGGCPSAQWATAWKGRVLRNAGAVISFNAAPIGGQSGSGVLVLIKDDKGELHTRLGILLAWRIGDGAWTDDGPNDYGAGLSLRQIYEIMEGNGQGHPIEASYSIVADKDKEAKNTKSAKERLNKVCPHCSHKIENHIVIPYKGGLRKTAKGEFMFCPELKLPDGSVTDTAQYYGGIRVGELYEDNGLFPWCPWGNSPPDQPPQLPPSNPNPPDGGDGGGWNGWPGRPPDGGGPVDPPIGFEKERQEYLDKITELQEKLTNLENISDSVQAELQTKLNGLESLSESLKAELGGTNSNLLEAQNAVNGLRDLLGAVEGQKDSLKTKIDQLLGAVKDKDDKISDLAENGVHYLDGATGGNGNTVENVSFTLGGMSLGMLALKYGVPLLLNRRRRKKRKEGEEEKDLDKGGDDGYNTIGPSPPMPPPPTAGDHDCGCDDAHRKHVHEHEHIHKHKHVNDYVVPLEQLPQGQTAEEIGNSDGDKHSSGLNPGFIPYGVPVSTPYYQQPVAANGLPPQFLHVPFGTRKAVTSEQIMTAFGELVNEYRDDQTMTINQIDTLLRQRLKQKYNID
jgi:hypothetical protein